MTKAELIRKVAKNVGVPDTDAKIFFELFLKRISAVVEIGQSIFVSDFGYFHLIKGNIKKPVFSFKDNEVSEEAVELVLFSEDKDLRKSDTKGLVFNIPNFDEEDYHPIDSAFSLSIGKPLIPLRGVPFDNIYTPTSGYEYRRLIESKVEKLISSSEIAESEENFPTLVIDARSYNSNQVQLQWDEKTRLDTFDKDLVDEKFESDVKPELSEYERQTKELKNIAWDFGEDLSRQIESDSILDIADERINMDTAPKQKPKIEDEAPKVQNEPENVNSIQENLKSEINLVEETESVEQIPLDQSSEKLNELLESENESTEIFQEELIDRNENEIYEDKALEIDNQNNEKIKVELSNEIFIQETFEVSESLVEENVPAKTELTDEEFWKSTSKYFEPYKPGIENNTDKDFQEVNSIIDNPNLINDSDSEQKLEEEIREVIGNEIFLDVNPQLDGTSTEIQNELQENIMDKNKEENIIELEKISDQKAEYFEPSTKKNIFPFIVFPLLVIVISLALYWYLEFYKKNEVIPKTKLIVLNSDNVKIVQRNFDIPITYPYLPKVNETTISETASSKNVEQNNTPKINEEIKKEPINTEEKAIEKEFSKQKETETKPVVSPVIPAGKSLNVGNNIYKYGDYYVVQVAAFRSSSISENEAGKYRNKGYNSFVEAAEIPERGTWYRVRVGNFSTKEEALRFLEKNIR